MFAAGPAGTSALVCYQRLTVMELSACVGTALHEADVGQFGFGDTGVGMHFWEAGLLTFGKCFPKVHPCFPKVSSPASQKCIPASQKSKALLPKSAGFVVEQDRWGSLRWQRRWRGGCTRCQCARCFGNGEFSLVLVLCISCRVALIACTACPPLP